MIRPGPIASSSALSRSFSPARLARAAMRRSGTLAFAWSFAFALAVAAQATDTPPLALKAPAAAPPSYDWTGWYVGGHLGEAWGPRVGPQRRGGAGDLRLVRSVSAVRRFHRNGKLLRGFKPATMTCSRTASSSAARSTRRSRPFPIAPASRSAAIRRRFAGHGRRKLSETVLSFGTVRGRIGYAPGIGSSMRPADSPGPTTDRC